MRPDVYFAHFGIFDWRPNQEHVLGFGGVTLAITPASQSGFALIAFAVCSVADTYVRATGRKAALTRLETYEATLEPKLVTVAPSDHRGRVLPENLLKVARTIWSEYQPGARDIVSDIVPRRAPQSEFEEFAKNGMTQ